MTLAEFSYNNSYQESIRMAPFEALYGKKNVEHLLTRLKWMIVVILDPILSKKLEIKLVLFRVI